MSTRTTKLPGIGDIWLVHYPYVTPGNMEKVRPGIIVGFDGDDKVIVQKLIIHIIMLEVLVLVEVLKVLFLL